MNDNGNHFWDWIAPGVETIKGGPGSGNFGHAGIHGHLGGSAPSKGGIPGAQEEAMDRDVRTSLGALMERIRTKGGFSYRPTQGFKEAGIDDGYMVSMAEHEKAVPIKDFTSQTLMNFWREKRNVVRNNPRAHFGAWMDEESGVVALDVSLCIKDRSEAVKMGIRNKQKSIFDLKNIDLIWLNADEGRLAAIGENKELKEAYEMAKKIFSEKLKQATQPVRVVAFGHAKTPEAEWEEFKAMGEGLGLTMGDDEKSDFLAMIAEEEAKNKKE